MFFIRFLLSFTCNVFASSYITNGEKISSIARRIFFESTLFRERLASLLRHARDCISSVDTY